MKNSSFGARNVALSLLLASSAFGCKNSNSGGGAGAPGTGSSGTVASAGTTGGSGMSGGAGSTSATGGSHAGTGGSGGSGTAGASAGSGSTAGQGASGTGTGGSAGSQAAGGAGSSAAGASGAGTAGASGSAGGSAGSSAGAGGSEDPSVTTCLSGITAAGRTVGDCERCLCQVGNCQTQLSALANDTNGNALVACAQTHTCWDQCCICGSSSAGAMCQGDYSDFGMGPCGNEVQTAAGLTPMSGTSGAIANGAMVMSKCDPAGTDDNSCSHATKLATCATAKCAAMCPQVKTVCP